MASEEEKPKPSDEKPDEGDKPEENDLLTRADKTAKRLAEENERYEKNIAELKTLEARRVLGGTTDAGSVKVEPTEETPAAYMKRVMTNTA